MTNREFVLETMRNFGANAAKNLQIEADNMNGTELYDKDIFIPSFQEAVKLKNMLERNIGFICKSTAGRVVRLLQTYDSDIYTQEPEELPAQWGFKWSTDPKKALPFIAISTSPYMKDDCCIENGEIYRSKIDNNVFSPANYPAGWEIYNE